MEPYRDTLRAQAMCYLDSLGYQISRDELIAQSPGCYCYMIYVGEPHSPFAVAVASAATRGLYCPDDAIEDVVTTFENWCRRTGHLDKIHEDDVTAEDFGEYSLRVELIPRSIQTEED